MIMLRFLCLLSKLPIINRCSSVFQSPVFHKKGQFYSKSYGKNIHRIKNGKVAVIGLPKSGNTWLMSLLKDCLDMEFVLIWDKEYKNKAGVGVFHNSFSPLVLYKRDLAGAVYIMRDIRDAIVSYYHYFQTEDYKRNEDPSSYYRNIESFYFEYFLSKIVHRYDWIHHAERYIEQGIPLVKYENLYDGPEVELGQLFLRWGIVVPIDKIKSAIENNSIDKLKKTGKTAWRKIPASHFRKGGYGNYINVLPEIVLEDINFRFGNYLKRWGYSI